MRSDLLGLLAGTTAGAIASIFLFAPVVRWMDGTFFTTKLRETQQGLEIYGYGMAFPYLLFLSPFAFLVLFPALNWFALRWMRPRALRAAICGAVAWSSLSTVVALQTPNMSNAELANAATLFAVVFAAFMAVAGAAAGLVSRAVAANFT